MIEQQRADSTDPREQFERLMSLVKRTLRHWWVVLITLIVGGAACAVFFVVRITPYRSESVILYSEGIRTNADAPQQTRTPQEAAVRLREMLMSRERLESLIRKFNLYPEVVQRFGYIDAVEEFRKHIQFRAPGSDTYNIGFEGRSPEQARDVTRALTQSLIDEETSERQKKAKITRDFLQEESERSEADLRKNEQELARFLADHPSFALDAMLLTPGAPAAGAAIRAAEATQAPASQRSTGGFYVPKPRTTPGQAPSAPVAAAPAVPPQLAGDKSRAEADLNAAQAAVAEALTRFTPQHPDVQAAQARLKAAQARYNAVTGAITAAMSSQPAPVAPVAPTTATTEAKDSQQSQRRVFAVRPAAPPPKKASSDELVKLETEWTLLMRNVNETRARHDQLEASFFKADIAASSTTGGGSGQMAVLDPPFLPTRPVPPGRMTIIAIFIALSMLIGSAFAVGAAAIDDRIYRGKDIVGLGVPLLAAVPRLKG